MRYALFLAVAPLALALAACESIPTTTTQTPPAVFTPSMSPASTGASSALERIAQGLAGALRNEDVRRRVRDAMRGSRFAEHKLALGDFLSAQPAVKQAAAQASGVDTTAFNALLREAGDLDFYAPFKDDRKSWHGGADVVVGYTADVNKSEFTTISLDGGRGQGSGHRRGPKATLIIHPAELKLARSEPQADAPGNVISDSNDGEYGGDITVFDKQGRVVSQQELIVRPNTICDPTLTGCGGGDGGTTAANTQLQWFSIYYGDGVGSAEIQYYFTDNTHNSVMKRFVGVPAGVQLYAYAPLWSGPLTFSGTSNVHLIETDFIFNDDWGYATLQSGNNGAVLHTIGWCFDVGDPNTTIHPDCMNGGQLTVTSDFRVTW
jgi:hypothetical protein